MDVSVRSVAAVALSGLYVGVVVGLGLEVLASRSDSVGRAALAAGVTAGVALTRSLWISLRLGSEEVTVTDYFRTRRLPWTEITAIGWERLDLPNGSAWAPSVAFRLAGGETVVAKAV
jgi:hypothetical protein